MDSSADALDALPRVLAGMFPGFCAVAVRTVSSIDAGFLCSDSEFAAIRGAAPKRRAEFLAGRAAARAALNELGLGRAIIPMGKDRAPEWPAGFVGSIAHTHSCAIAVVGRRSDVSGLGLDIEVSNAVSEELWGQIFSSAERAHLAKREQRERVRWATVAFCAKEAFYKFQYPATRTWIDYDSAEVHLDVPGHRFDIQVDARAMPTLAMRKFEGIFGFAGPFSLAGMWGKASLV